MKHTLLLCGLLAGFSLAAAPELVMEIGRAHV